MLLGFGTKPKQDLILLHPMINKPQSIFRIDNILITLLFFLLGIVLIRTAWVGDDVYITLRTVDNITSGHGLSWNTDERVQSYTHPLWMVLMIPVYFLSRDAYLTVLFLSFLFTGFTVFVLARQKNAPFILSLLLLSKAFMDYSVSGLENPATHFLLILFILFFLKREEWSQREIFLISLIATLMILNRMDTALFFAPVLAYLLFKHFSARTVFSLMLGFTPFIIWELFSLFYYGFPFPNTAYAKLGTGISRIDLLHQGWVYFADSFTRDPLTLTVTLIGLAMALWKGGTKERLIASGVILYMLYILDIGGDFMSGRFLSTLFLVGALLLSRFLEAKDGYWRASVVVVSLLISFMAPYPSLFPSTDQPPYTKREIQTGINDERAFYYQNTGLLPVIQSNGQSLMKQRWVQETARLRKSGTEVYADYNIGFMGYYAGPNIHIVDMYALCDPLLARLPALHQEKWRIGHFDRALPDGYIETLETGRNQIKDPHLAIYYDKLSFIIREPLGNFERLRVIWEMNTGQYDYLLTGDNP